MVIIKNFKMPKSCVECPIYYDDLCCSIDNRLYWPFEEDGRHPLCPLEERGEYKYCPKCCAEKVGGK